EDFVDFVAYRERSGKRDAREVRYAQTRDSPLDPPPPPSTTNKNAENDNLRNEYATLFSHVEKDIPWARIALQQTPEAINLWIGNSL
ncbi:cupin-like domain-containing protein, partial [Acidithiobacillus sp. MC6.1]|nr:cupin-like domain-containing protein [Acidithiobacillus sp. MC6.1]